MSAMKFVQKNSKIRKLGGKYHKAGLLRSVNYGKRKQQNIMLMKKKNVSENPVGIISFLTLTMSQ